MIKICTREISSNLAALLTEIFFKILTWAQLFKTNDIVS